MQRTIAIFTHARAVNFNAKDILRHSKTELDSEQYFKTALHKFLIDDIDERIMGVENQLESEYERTRMRDAVIELIDVLQTERNGMPYRNKYFDKNEMRIREYEKEEQTFREKLCEYECERWRYLLKGAEVTTHHVLDKYYRDCQIRAVDEENQGEILARTIIEELRTLKKALSAVVDVRDGINLSFSWDFTDTTENESKGLLDETPTISSAQHQQQSNKKQKEELNKKLKVVESTTGRYGENLPEKTEEGFRKEQELALAYMTMITSFPSGGYFKENPSAKFPMKTDYEMVAHLKLVASQLEETFREYQSKESPTAQPSVRHTVQNILKRVTSEITKGLKQNTASYRYKSKWDIGSRNKSSEVKTLAEWCLEAESSCNSYITQAIEFLVNRRMNIILLQAIQVECDIQKIHHDSNVDDNLKKLYADAFEKIQQLYRKDENNPFIRQMERQIAAVHRMKLMLQLEDNPSKREEMSKELEGIEKQLEQQKDVCLSRVLDFTHILMYTASHQAMDYIRSQTKSQLMRMKSKDYEEEVRLLSPKILEEISDEIKAYFDLNRINEMIKLYLQLHCQMLPEMAAFVSAKKGVGKTAENSVAASADHIFAIGKILYVYCF